MKIFPLLAAAFSCLLAPVAFAGAPPPAVLQASISTDSTEVHPDSVFDVVLTLNNPTNAAESIRVPNCAWDRLWKPSNHMVSWDAFDCDDNTESTVEIPAHGSYTFPGPLKMWVGSDVKKTRVDFRLGFRAHSFAKLIWSNTVSLEVSQ